MTRIGRLASRVPPSAAGPVLAAAVLVGHLSLAVSASYTFDGYQGYPIPWPANGVTLAALVLAPRRRWGWALAAAAASELISSAWFGLAPGWAMAYVVVNLVEVVVAALLFRRWSVDRDVGTRTGLVAFVAAAMLVGPAVGGAAGATVSAAQDGAPWLPTFGFFWSGDALGQLVAGATVISWLSGPASRSRGRPLEALAILLLAAALGAAPAVLGERPVAYLPLVGLLWAALRLGVAGALLAALVVTYVRGYYVARGFGELAAAAGSAPSALAYLTALLVVSSLAAWVLAVEVRHRETAERREATERQARVAAQALVDRLARMRAFADAALRAGSRDEVVAAWQAHAPEVLGGRDHRLVLADGSATVPVDGACAEGRAVAERRVVVAPAPPAPSGTGPDGEVEAVVAAPLVEGERVLGVLSSRHDADAATDPVRRETAAAAATRLAEALVRVRLLTEAVDSSHRLAVLQDLTSRLGRATTTAAVVDLVLQGVRRQFGASAAGLFLPDPSGVLRRRGTVGPAPEDLSGPSDVVPTDGGPVAAAVAEQRPRYGPTPHPAVAAAADPSCPDPEAPSWAVLPLVFNRRLRGVAWFAWPAGARPGPEDRALHEAFAEQCAAALRRVTATDAEHDVAIKLQQALLPQRFPAVDGVAAAARYVPSSEALSVGGDWYDVVARPDGRVVVVVGDVVGHDVTAAAAMGRLRSSLATIAVDAPDPAAAVRRVHGFPGGPDIGFATALYLDFDPVTGVLRYSCAGHPPPLLVKPWGEAEFLMSGRSGPLFAAEPRDVRSGAVTVPAASLVVCYTDGLVERRDRRFHDGLVGLARSCLRHRHRPLPAFTDGVLADLTAGRRLADDVALLCAVLTPRTGTVRSPRPPATPSVAAAAGPGPPPTRA